MWAFRSVLGKGKLASYCSVGLKSSRENNVSDNGLKMASIVKGHS